MAATLPDTMKRRPRAFNLRVNSRNGSASGMEEDLLHPTPDLFLGPVRVPFPQSRRLQPARRPVELERRPALVLARHAAKRGHVLRCELRSHGGKIRLGRSRTKAASAPRGPMPCRSGARSSVFVGSTKELVQPRLVARTTDSDAEFFKIPMQPWTPRFVPSPGGTCVPTPIRSRSRAQTRRRRSV